ncbi:hypothetical protein [Fluviispira sanaruensis]|uniref:DUF4175 domain-containing protein n=1 Tax=Fluviispira sanaruensis TaxID=2493639 RepID=A0A4P2VJM9_FLUSA|nr:hypothetical protein [Fluviispira sanaruensis]BBH52921.1 hypothetical protein JCM31447_13640 [Fluviispira sanaruensis]
MKYKLNIFLFSILTIITNFLFFFRVINKDLAWLSFPISLLFLNWLDLFIFRGLFLYKNLSKQRIDLNLNAAGIKSHSLHKKLILRILIVSLLSLSGFTYFMKDDLNETINYISEKFKFTQPYIKIEHPTYSEASTEEIKLSNNNMKILLDTSSYLEFKIKNFKSNTSWKLNIKYKNYDKDNEYNYQLSESGVWSSSVASLYENLKKDKNELATVNKNEVKIVDYTLTNGTDQFIGSIEITPTPLPILKFEHVQMPEQDIAKSIGKLYFYLNASSSVPLSLISLSIRTKSGYHFDKTIAEFANASQLSFVSELTELVTLGIPFMPEDTLYVKAIAKTVLTDIIGESKELEFPVRTPMQVRKDIILNLEKALKNLNSIKSFINSEKEKVFEPLAKSAQLAMQLGRSGMVRKNIIETMSYVENINKKNDKYYKDSVKKIQLTLDMLKRQQKMEEGGNLLARLQNLKYNIAKLKNSEGNFDEILAETNDLKNKSSDLNKQLLILSQQSSYGLSQLEKSIVQNILQSDKTFDKLKETESQLKLKNFNEAQKNAQTAAEMGMSHLGTAMQILQQARNRTIQEARKNLQNADNHIEKTRENENRNMVLQELAQAKKSLDKTPQINDDFNESLSEAKEETSAAQQNAQLENSSEMEKSRQLAQFAIEKALMSLQNEEDSDKDLQKEQDARAFRSSMDVLAAQGMLDSSWRKKILEEIARLKSHGEQSDSPMIRYLESRLR